MTEPQGRPTWPAAQGSASSLRLVRDLAVVAAGLLAIIGLRTLFYGLYPLALGAIVLAALLAIISVWAGRVASHRDSGS